MGSILTALSPRIGSRRSWSPRRAPGGRNRGQTSEHRTPEVYEHRKVEEEEEEEEVDASSLSSPRLCMNSLVE